MQTCYPFVTKMKMWRSVHPHPQHGHSVQPTMAQIQLSLSEYWSSWESLHSRMRSLRNVKNLYIYNHTNTHNLHKIDFDFYFYFYFLVVGTWPHITLLSDVDPHNITEGCSKSYVCSPNFMVTALSWLVCEVALYNNMKLVQAELTVCQTVDFAR